MAVTELELDMEACPIYAPRGPHRSVDVGGF